MAKHSKVNKTEVGKIGSAPVVLLRGADDEQATVCLVLEGELEAGKSKPPTRYFSRKLALIALANADKLRAFVADPRFNDPAPVVAPKPTNVVPLAPVAPAQASVADEMAALRAELAALRSAASGRLSPAAA